MNDPRLDRLRGLIRDVPDFPKPGILFKDITPLLADAAAFADAIELLAERVRPLEPDLIAGPEARGFLFGAPLALKLGVGFAPIRKSGKLPWRTIEESYQLEYGEDTVAAHEDAFAGRSRVLIADDLLATGGTVAASSRLVRKGGGTVVGAAFLVELDFLAGRERLGDLAVTSLLNYA
ncbi:MAG: adenine phosphoribosyltransferase [Planctomycetota bacterium]